MERLLAGYRRFRTDGWPERRRLFEELADHGQRPRAMVVACADSRVDPGMIFDAGPGELFVVRNVAALVPPYAPDLAYHGTSAALEFGVRVLQVRDLLVMGHGLCGGVHGLLHGVPAEASDFVAGWMGIAAPVRARALACDSPEAQQLCGEQEVVKLALANLRGFPWIAAREAAGQLVLHGAHFDVRTGRLSMLGEDGHFTEVS
ncbi:MAG: carbonic anhydrase [Rhodospirillales bacterium]|nr:carbonic anhydrase [Rhodospirillales bacterium]